MNYSAEYWDRKYLNHQTGWDMGYASPPIVEYFEQVEDKTKKILIPGAGNAWEAEYIWKNGFTNTYILDYSSKAMELVKKRMPFFPEKQLIFQDFFQHKGSYDFIVEQTFFSSLPVNLRTNYAQQMHKLLTTKGKLMGLLFNHEFHREEPPFGGTPEEYRKLFAPYFHFLVLETAYNSIKPRATREHFVLFQKK